MRQVLKVNRLNERSSIKLEGQVRSRRSKSFDLTISAGESKNGCILEWRVLEIYKTNFTMHFHISVQFWISKSSSFLFLGRLFELLLTVQFELLPSNLLLQRLKSIDRHTQMNKKILKTHPSRFRSVSNF